MSNVVETVTKTDFFETPVKSNSNAQEQEVNDYTEFLKIEYQKYRQYKIILEGIEECIDEDNLHDDLINKIKSVILGASVSQTRLSDSSLKQENSDTVLDIPLSNIELTYSESNKLVNCLKSRLDNKCVKLRNDCFSLLGKDIEIDIEKSESPLELTQEDTVLLQFRNKLALEQECFIRNQIELLELLEELKNTRLKTLPDVTDQKIQECSLRSKINYLKSQLARDKCRLDIFMETNHSLKAYTEIIKDMKEQREQLNLEIEQLKDLKKRYSQVSCKEYDDILKSYLQYKASFAKKKRMYELYE